MVKSRRVQEEKKGYYKTAKSVKLTKLQSEVKIFLLYHYLKQRRGRGEEKFNGNVG